MAIFKACLGEQRASPYVCETSRPVRRLKADWHINIHGVQSHEELPDETMTGLA